MTLRSDNFTQTQKIPELFSDFLTDFKPHPITRELSRVKNEQAIKQSLRNLIMTNYGERLFQSSIGSGIRRALFDFNDFVTAEDLRIHIEQTITNNEKRVQLLDLYIEPREEQNRMLVSITFAIINNKQIQQLDLILRRVR